METYVIVAAVAICLLLLIQIVLTANLIIKLKKFIFTNEQKVNDLEGHVDEPHRFADIPKLAGSQKTEQLASSDGARANVSAVVEDKTELLQAVHKQSIPDGDKTVLLSNSQEGHNNLSDKTELLHKQYENKTFASLEIKNGPTNTVINIYQDTVHIGRDPEICDVVLSDDIYVGKHHAVICFKNDKASITDLNTKNGTYIDGQKIIGSKVIDSNCTIKAANTELLLRFH